MLNQDVYFLITLARPRTAVVALNTDITRNSHGNMNAKHARIIAATFFMTAVTITAFVMLNAKAMQDWTFAVTLAFSIAAFALISSIGDVLILRFWNLELKFKEIQETEASVKEIATAILDVIETQSHGLMLSSYDDKAANAAIEKLKKLIS